MRIPTVKVKRTLWFMLHWRIGLFAGFFMIWLALTGIILNHSRSVGLHNVFIESPMILALYDMNVPSDYVKTIDIKPDQTIVHTKDGVIELSSEQDVKLEVARYYRGEGLSLEKLILDLHTGKIIGIPGTMLSDLAALALIFLTGTGLYNLWRRKRA